ncbi:hypothetical protein [Cellulomonas sp. HZM]|uniref:WapI family immunity protein n=1 Tax=Cellulomonas sp. HZM TaxID=1454010 RepID=UPI0012DBD41D|nr:hypothetical protein [Cellulomonas sp. HZM]
MGYEFPSAPARDSDANWLVVEGRVRTADGRAWTFRDPCLMTDDLPRMSRWLRAVADGRVPATAVPVPESRLLAFTEPNLAWSVGSVSADEVVVRTHLSLESAPRLLAGDVELYEYFVELRLTPAALRGAAAAWDDEAAHFPVR